MLYGTVRDLLIGITVELADGTVAHAGGKVVKNVAGYDLGKLFTGSWGTLGLITRCAFRLHPVPEATATVVAAYDVAALQAIRDAQVVPSAVEVDTATGQLAVLVEGTPAGVRDRATALAKLLNGEEGPPPEWWGRYPWQAGEVGVKVTAALSQVPAVLAAAHGMPVRGSAGTGVLYAALPADDAAAGLAALRTAAESAGGHAVVLTAPPGIRDSLDLWGPVAGLDLMRRVKQQFDPEGRFAAGRFAGGI
jgi:glycolate oxidase FAD binding subunit